MQIVKTWEELTPLLEGNTTGRVALARKKSASQLHTGHVSLINYAKTNYDICLVSFWNPIEFIYWFYPDESIVEALNDTVWDSTGCLDWCEINGADIVILPDDGYTATYMYGYDKVIAKSQVDALWESRGYPEINTDEMYRYTRATKAMMMYLNWKAYDRPTNYTYIDTWKDGCGRFVLNDHINQINPGMFDMLDPVVNPDGLYYSTASETYTQDEIDLVKGIPGVVDNVGYNDTTALQQALVSTLDPNGTYEFDPYRIHVTYGGIVGEANDLIEVFYILGSYPNGKERADMYPILKLNVR